MNQRLGGDQYYQRQGSHTSYNTATTAASNNGMGGYQSVIDSQFRTSQRQQPREGSPDDIDEELRDQVDDAFLDDHIDPRFRNLAKTSDLDDYDIDASDTENEKKIIEEYSRQFGMMSDTEKLVSIAGKTQELYKKAMEFDQKMIELNKQYKFLDYGLQYEEQRLKMPTTAKMGSANNLGK